RLQGGGQGARAGRRRLGACPRTRRSPSPAGKGLRHEEDPSLYAREKDFSGTSKRDMRPRPGRCAMGMRRGVVLVGALALALSEAHARAGWWPPERPPASVEGPWDTRWTLEASDRLRGEFVDFFTSKAGSKTPNFRYNFLGNRFQAGIRVRRDPWEAFVQFQHTVLDDVPVDGAGPGGPYFTNTKRSFQEQGWLRQGWVRAEDLLGVKAAGIVVGRQLWRDGLEAPARDANLQWLK